MWAFIGVCSLAIAPNGLSAGAQLASLRPLATDTDTVTNAKATEKAEAVKDRAREAGADLNPTAAAWWFFTTLVLSLGAAVGGSLLGSGPEFMLRRVGTTRTTQTSTMQPA